jgi:hypothetical protein
MDGGYILFADVAKHMGDINFYIGLRHPLVKKPFRTQDSSADLESNPATGGLANRFTAE